MREQGDRQVLDYSPFCKPEGPTGLLGRIVIAVVCVLVLSFVLYTVGGLTYEIWTMLRA